MHWKPYSSTFGQFTNENMTLKSKFTLGSILMLDNDSYQKTFVNMLKDFIKCSFNYGQLHKKYLKTLGNYLIGRLV